MSLLRKQFFSLLVILLAITAIPLTVFLVKQQQEVRTRAANSQISYVERDGNTQVVVSDFDPTQIPFEGKKFDVISLKKAQCRYDSAIYQINAENDFEIEWGSNACGPFLFAVAEPSGRLPWNPLRHFQYKDYPYWTGKGDVYRGSGTHVTGVDANATVEFEILSSREKKDCRNEQFPCTFNQGSLNALDSYNIVTLLKKPDGNRVGGRIKWPGGNFNSGVEGRDTWINAELRGFSGTVFHLASPKGPLWIEYDFPSSWYYWVNGQYRGELPPPDHQGSHPKPIKRLDLGSGEPISTPTSPPPTETPPPPTPTPTSSPGTTTLEISFALQGVLSPRNTTRITEVEILDTANNVTFSKSDVLANFQDGIYRATFSLGENFSSGNYVVKIKPPNALKKRIENISAITAGTNNVLPQSTIIMGDMNDDNKLDAVDYANLSGCLEIGGVKISSCANPMLADLNDDGSVTVQDLAILIFNFASREGD